MNVKLDFDATKLSEALKYQIHVAIDYCHTLEKHDVLWIEVFGDVTVEGRDQVEVKDYSDSLTDSHENFWNTLNNWLNPDFQHQQYTNLVLLTTQAYGERASLKNWERLDVDERLAVLESIHKTAEARLDKATLSKDDDENKSIDDGNRNEESKRKSTTPSKVLKLQRKVLAMDIRESLLDALPKIKIVTEQPDLLGLISKYKMRYLKSIQPHLMDSFLDDLFGFMTSAIKITGGWKFTTAEFDKKFAELTARYLIGTLKFPRLNSDDLEMKATEMNVRDRLFAKKLEEIGGEELILQAAADLLHAQQYIAELVKDFTTSQADVEDYRKNQLRMHRSSRSSAMRKCDSTLPGTELQKASCAFYDERCAATVDRFSTYDFTPIEFRNGIYHMLADETPSNQLNEFHWRLWK